MKRLLIIISILLLVVSCGKKRRGNKTVYVNNTQLSAFELQKAYMECSVYAYNNRCTDFRSNRRLTLSQFYDQRCFGFYKRCLLNRGVTY